MPENKPLDILKGALLLEHKGKALYSSVAESSKVESVKELFGMLVREEEKHIKVLNKQYSRLAKGESLDISELEEERSSTLAAIITEKIVEDVAGAGYEAAVVSAALEFEKNAVKYYSEHAQSAESEAEKKLFEWLTDWEKNHMLMLAKVDNELKEKIWYDNQFWPLD
jgi:rubrerythrin